MIKINKSRLSKLDRIFSLYIRLRDSNEAGYILCPTCTKVVFYKNAHCCHFVSRKHLSTRFDEKNCHGGCCGCNTFNAERHIYLLSKYIDKKYGAGTCDLLLMKSRMYSKMGDFELETLSKHYSKQVKKLKEERGV